MKTFVISAGSRSVNGARPSWIHMIVLSSLFVVLCYPVLAGLVVDWWTRYEYSHGFLIPLVSGYLLWKRRAEIRTCLMQPSLIGCGVFVLGMLTYLLGYAVDEEFLQRMALPLILIGLVYFLGGPRMIQLTLFPLSYLFLMIPIPHTAFKAISLRLRLFDAHVAASWVSWLGIPILQDGYLLFLPKVTLEVADGCSGVLSVVSLLAIGILYVHLTQTSWLNKVVLWLSIVPIAIGANIARIVTISVSVYVFGDWILDTFFHELGGTFNFLLGLLSIVLLGAFLTKMFRPRVRAC